MAAVNTLSGLLTGLLQFFAAVKRLIVASDGHFWFNNLLSLDDSPQIELYLRNEPYNQLR